MFIVAYAFMYALALIQLGAYVNELPATLATHFARGGAPNGYMHKDSFILFYLGFMFFMPGVFFAVGSLVEKFPLLVNLPNKDYWLAPARREASIRSLVHAVRLLGLMTGLFLIAVEQLIINANMLKPPRLDEQGTWVFMGVFVFSIISFLGWTLMRFRKPGKEP